VTRLDVRPLQPIRIKTKHHRAPTRHVDLGLVVSVIALAIFGAVMQYSATRQRLESQGVDPAFYLKRQLVFIVIGIGAMAAAAFVDYRRLHDHAALLYGAAILGLLAVLSPLGSTRNGAQAWFDLGPFQLQPSEFAKLAVIVGLAAFCHEHKGDLDAWRLGLAIGISVVVLGLLYIQPDLGTAMILTVVTVLVLVMAGARLRHLVVLTVLSVASLVVAYQSGVLADYQVDRLTSFADQSADISGEGFHVEQSKIAIGAGELDGRGLFNGLQTSLSYVPEQHTDFVFTVVAEEFGFIGAAGLLGVLGFVVFRMWRAAQTAKETFGSLLCVGVMAMFVFQIFQNVGMTMGIVPITGIPLPFLSHGGSSTIMAFAAVGLVVNVHARRFT
jgi:rod shape determining protein RodA